MGMLFKLIIGDERVKHYLYKNRGLTHVKHEVNFHILKTINDYWNYDIHNYNKSGIYISKNNK